MAPAVSCLTLQRAVWTHAQFAESSADAGDFEGTKTTDIHKVSGRQGEMAAVLAIFGRRTNSTRETQSTLLRTESRSWQ